MIHSGTSLCLQGPTVCAISYKKHLITVPGWLWVLLTQFQVQLHGFSLHKKMFGLCNKSIGALTVVRNYTVQHSGTSLCLQGPSVYAISQKKHLITVPSWPWVLLTQFEVQLHGFSLHKRRFELRNKSIGASTVVRNYTVQHSGTSLSLLMAKCLCDIAQKALNYNPRVAVDFTCSI